MIETLRGLLVCALLTGLCAACGDDAAGPDAGTDGGDVDGGATDGGSDDAGATLDAGPPVGLDFERIDIGDMAGALTDFVFVPGTDGEMLTTDHAGRVVHFRLEGGAAEYLGEFDVPDVLVEGPCGVHSIALDPDWETNDFVYVAHCGPESQSRVTRFAFDGTGHDDVSASAVRILDVAEDRGMYPNNHSIGSLVFELDGTLITALGDKAYEPNGQDPHSMPAALLRIVPSREPGVGGYEPAPDNPFADGVDGAPEVYAYGIRYGWRIALDELGRIWVADVGGSVAEEIDLLGGPGGNYGWNECEGPCDPPDADRIDPLTWWSHEDEGPYYEEDPLTEPTIRRVAWLGDPYVPETDRYGGLLSQRIPFGDTCLGWVRVIWANAAGEITTDELLGHLPHITAWRQGPDDWIYVTTFGSCDPRMPIEPAALWRAVPRHD